MQIVFKTGGYLKLFLPNGKNRRGGTAQQVPALTLNGHYLLGNTVSQDEKHS